MIFSMFYHTNVGNLSQFICIISPILVTAVHKLSFCYFQDNVSLIPRGQEGGGSDMTQEQPDLRYIMNTMVTRSGQCRYCPPEPDKQLVSI